LCVKNNRSQYMGFLGYPVAREFVRDARTGEAGLRDIDLTRSPAPLSLIAMPASS